MMTSIFDEKDEAALLRYLQIAAKYKQFDVKQAKRLALAAIRYYKGDASQRAILTSGQALENQWYASLKAGDPDYSVYDHEFFVSDVWACWVVYSRKYLWNFFRTTLGCSNLAQDLFRDAESVVDLGCGIGCTTAALKELFPAASVYGTQIEETFQFKVATAIGAERRFTITPLVHFQTDLVFASEYFEHFQRPIEHLLDILRVAKPKYLIIANSFGSHSVGHFDEYLDNRRVHVREVEQIVDVKLSNKTVGRDFNAVLRNCGYERVETGFWNNRPAVWKKR